MGSHGGSWGVCALTYSQLRPAVGSHHPERNSHRGGAERHKEGEERVGVSGESGRWVSRADSRRKNRAERRGGRGLERRHGAVAFGLRALPKTERRLRDVIRWVILTFFVGIV